MRLSDNHHFLGRAEQLNFDHASFYSPSWLAAAVWTKALNPNEAAVSRIQRVANGQVYKEGSRIPAQVECCLVNQKNNSLAWRPHTHKYSLKVPPPPFMTMTPTVYLVNKAIR
jgi:hypothetical protein